MSCWVLSHRRRSGRSNMTMHPLTRFRTVPLLLFLAAVLVYVFIKNNAMETNTMDKDGADTDAPRRYVTKPQFVLLASPSLVETWLLPGDPTFDAIVKSGINGIAITTSAWL